MLKDLFHYSNQTCIKLVPILFFQIIDPSINNVMENAIERSMVKKILHRFTQEMIQKLSQI